MARPLRIEFSGALYCISSRGNEHDEIYLDDIDRAEFLDLLASACQRFNWTCHGYCLMDDHYHMLIETGDANLSKGMKFINGTFTQNFNRRHNREGHVFQGRFKSVLVERERYLLELCRYIVLSPVREKMVRSAKDWPWSSYRGMVNPDKKHDCLTTDWVLSNFGKRQKTTIEKYRKYILEGKNQPSPFLKVRNQVFLGSDEFIEDMKSKVSTGKSLKGNSKKKKQKPIKTLKYYQKTYKIRNEAIAMAYLSGHYTLEQVGDFFDLSYATVSRVVKEFEGRV